MISRYITTDDVLAEVIDEFNIQSTGWKVRAHRWLLSACDKIGASNFYSNNFKHETVEDHEAPLPCDMMYLEGIAINTDILWIASALTARNTSLVLDDKSFHKVTFHGNVARFPFTYISNGDKVTFYYQGIPYSNGKYWIPNNELYKEAIKWYVVMIHLLRGGKHPVINFQMARAEWLELKDAARNEVNRMSKMEFERLRNNFNLITFDDWFTDRFLNNK